MHKINSFLWSLCMACIMFTMAACEAEKQQGDETIIDPNAQTIEDQKEYLTNAGTDVLNVFKANDQKDAIELIEGIIYKLDEYKWDYDAFYDYADEGPDVIFGFPKYVSQVAQGRHTPMTAPIYTYSFANNAVVFEADDNTHTWVNKGKSSDNSLTVKMKSRRGTNCVAKCWGEGKVTTHSVTYYAAEAKRERYYYFPKYCYVGYNNGEYASQYDYNTGAEYYQYVGSGNGAYKYNDGCIFVEVGDGHGSYIRSNVDKDNYYDEYTYYKNQSKYYTNVGANQGNFEKITAADARYKVEWVEEYNSQYGYYNYYEKYVEEPQYGCYAKFNQYYMVFDERAFPGATERVAQVQLPEILHYTLTEDSKTIVDVTQSLDLVENDHYNVNASYKVSNLSWKQKAEVNYEKAYASLDMYYGSTTIFNATINLPTYQMTKKDDTETYEEYGERVADHWEALLEDVGELTAEVNIMGKVQARSRISNIGKMYEAYANWEKKYNCDYNDRLSLEAANALRTIYGKYCVTGLYYNSDVLQAQMMLQPYERHYYSYYYDYYYGYQYNDRIYYGLEPVIYFPNDGTSYSFGDYFSKDRFGNIYDLTEYVVNSYIRVLKLYDVDEIDLR